jgi:hypothetical protein
MKTNTITKAPAPGALLIAWLLLPQTAQCFYNPSTGRWLSRDPMAERAAPNLMAFKGNDLIDKIDRDGRITVTPVLPWTVTHCGNYIVAWSFTLDRPAPSDGYIVQKVTTREEYSTCGGNSPRTESAFWEAFFVPAGSSTPEGQLNPIGISYTDKDSFLHPFPTWGWHAVRGELKFFTIDEIGEIQESGFESGRVGAAGDLVSTPSEPAWWPRTPSNGEREASRFASASWNCCCGTKYKEDVYNHFSFTPGYTQ